MVESKMWERDPEYMAIIDDIKDHPFVADLSLFPQHVNGNRQTHSYMVSYYSYRITKSLGWNYRAVARAGLLHDLFYYKPGDLDFSHGNHLRNHPKIALINARLVTDLSAMEEDIIIKHMWLATAAMPKYKESFVVTFVDKYIAVDDFVRPSFSRMMKAFRVFVKTLVLPALKLNNKQSNNQQLEDAFEESLEELDKNE